MKCIHCGCDNPEGSAFCVLCGQPMESGAPVSFKGFQRPGGVGASTAPAPEPIAPEAEPVPAPVYAAPTAPDPAYAAPTAAGPAPGGPQYVWCTACGSRHNAGTPFCTNCGQPLPKPAPARPAPAPYPGSYAAPMEVRKAKKPWYKSPGLWIGGGAGLLVLAVLIVGLATGWFGLTRGPLLELYSAGQATLKADNFTADVNIRDGGNELLSGTFQVQIDREAKELAVVMDRGEDTIALYKGYLLYVDNQGRVWREDYREQVDAFFSAEEQADQPTELDLRQLLDQIDNSGSTRREVEEHLDLDQCEELLKTWALTVNDKEWLEDTLDYSTSREDGAKVHQFELNRYNVPRFLEKSLEIFEPAFRIPGEYDEAMEELRRMDMDVTSLTLVFRVSGGKLSGAEVYGYTDSARFSGTVELRDFGKTEIDTDLLQRWLDQTFD